MNAQAQLPLGLQSYKRSRGSLPEVILRNLYLEEDKSGGSIDKVLRLQRAGLKPLVSFTGTPRGLFQMSGALGGLVFVVAGSTLYSTNLSTITAIGNVGSDGQDVRLAANSFKLGIISAGQFWTWDGTTLTNIALPNAVSPIDIVVIDDFFVLTLANGTFYWLSPDQADFSSADAILQYATAEALPDGLVTIARIRDELYMFGTTTIEVWQETGLANPAFQRASGRLLDRGCLAKETVVAFDNSVLFVGNDGIVYRMSDIPTRVSEFGIEERISLASGPLSAFAFTSEGHKFYCLNIPGQGTFAFDASSQVWSEFSTIGATTWRAIYGQDTTYGPLALDTSGVLSRIDPNCNTDVGYPIERTISGTVATSTNRIANPSLSVWTGCDVATNFAISWNDALTAVIEPRSVVARAGSDIMNIFRLGATRGPYRTFTITTSDVSHIRISGAMLNDGRAS